MQAFAAKASRRRCQFAHASNNFKIPCRNLATYRTRVPAQPPTLLTSPITFHELLGFPYASLTSKQVRKSRKGAISNHSRPPAAYFDLSAKVRNLAIAATNGVSLCNSPGGGFKITTESGSHRLWICKLEYRKSLAYGP